MKNFLKVILPAFAIMLALGLSSFTVEDAPIGYYNIDGDIFEVPTDCVINQEIDCKEEVEGVFYQLYDTPAHAIAQGTIGKLQRNEP